MKEVQKFFKSHVTVHDFCFEIWRQFVYRIPN